MYNDMHNYIVYYNFLGAFYRAIIFKMQVTFIYLLKLKGNNFTPYYVPPFNMNRMKIFNLVIKAKTVKSGVVNHLKWHIIFQ